MPVLVAKQAPDFTVPAVLGSGEIVDQFNFYEAIDGKYAVLFFYPLDFTFVCPSELIALDHRMSAFKERNVEVVAVSIDSHFTHNAWRNTPIEKGGIGLVKYTMAADMAHSICRSYGVEHPQAAVALRGTFLIDKAKIVQHQVVNALPLGRDLEDLINTIDKLQYHEKHGEVCPANWKKGSQGMKATPEGVASYLAKEGQKL